MTSEARQSITGVILAGGRSSRMGGIDKGLLEINGQPMVTYIVRALRPQVGTLLINANRNLGVYSRLGECQVVKDTVGDYAGPLAGMASAMQTATTPLILTVPCDSPLLARDLAHRLHQALYDDDAEIAVAVDGERLQPVFALLQCNLLASILGYLDAGDRKIDRWFARHRVTEVDFSDSGAMFYNINTPDERRAIENRLRRIV